MGSLINFADIHSPINRQRPTNWKLWYFSGNSVYGLLPNFNFDYKIRRKSKTYHYWRLIEFFVTFKRIENLKNHFMYFLLSPLPLLLASSPAFSSLDWDAAVKAFFRGVRILWLLFVDNIRIAEDFWWVRVWIALSISGQLTLATIHVKV